MAFDLHAIKPAHYAIHERLENWARAVRENKGPQGQQPMFRHYKPYLVAREPSGAIPIDQPDAQLIERQVAILPDIHAFVIRWAYVFPWRHPMKVCRMWEISQPELADLIEQGRGLLRERLTGGVSSYRIALKSDSPSGATSLCGGVAVS